MEATRTIMIFPRFDTMEMIDAIRGGVRGYRDDAFHRDIYDTISENDAAVMTTGIAGGMHYPYKGLVLAAPDGALNSLPTA